MSWRGLVRCNVKVATGTINSCPNAEPEVAIASAVPRRWVNQPLTKDVALTGLVAASARAATTP